MSCYVLLCLVCEIPLSTFPVICVALSSIKFVLVLGNCCSRICLDFSVVCLYLFSLLRTVWKLFTRTSTFMTSWLSFHQSPALYSCLNSSYLGTSQSHTNKPPVFSSLCAFHPSSTTAETIIKFHVLEEMDTSNYEDDHEIEQHA